MRYRTASPASTSAAHGPLDAVRVMSTDDVTFDDVPAIDGIQALVDRRSATFSLDRARLRAAKSRKDLRLIEPIEVLAGTLKVTERQIANGRQFVAYDSYVLEAKDVGDDVEVYLPHFDLTLHGVIDDVEINGDIIRWSGRFEDFNSTQNRFSISQTMIDDYVLGTFETPMGSFSLEAKNGRGWIADQAEEFRLPPGGKDYVEMRPSRAHALAHD
jgi:hypothetical protein